MRKGDWTVLTNHGTVLVYIAKHPKAAVQRIAQEAGLSIRAVQNIIIDLEKTGYITRQKEGGRNHYTVHPERPIRHRLQGVYPVGNMLQAIGYVPQKTNIRAVND